MTLLGRVCAIALLLASGAVQAQQAPPPPPPPPPGPPSQQRAPAPASLSGRVVTADTGQPVRSADIRLVGDGTGTLVAKTDDEGRFELAAVNLGSYSLQVRKAGFVSTIFGLSKDQPGTFGLSAGQRINLGDLKLLRGGVIAGRILDPAGDPIAEVVVSADRLSFLTPAVRRVVSRETAQTNDLGDFRVHGLSPGKYYVSARLLSGSSTPTFYPGVTNMSEAVPVEVRAGQDSLGITMQLAPAAFSAVSGTVVDSKGAPFGAANVWLVSSRTDGVQVSSALVRAVTDAAGRFRIENISPGDYRLEVFSVAWMDKVATQGASAGPPPELASVPVSITSGRTEELAVRTSTGFRVRGQVFLDGAPVSASAAAGVHVTAAAPMASNLSGVSVPVTDGISPDGTFGLTGVQGLRMLRAIANGYHHTSVAGADVSERGIDVTADITGVEIHLTSRPTRLEGNVVDAAGAPISTATILVFSIDRADWLLPGNRRYRDFRVTGMGKFSATGLPAGNYLAAIVPDEDAGRWADPDYLDGLRARATLFTITDGATTTVTLQVRK